MLKSNARKQISDVFELLESDDELPDTYDDVADNPKYQNDSRFEPLEPIEFKWIHKKLAEYKNEVKCSEQDKHINKQKPEEEKQCLSNEFTEKQKPPCIKPRSAAKIVQKPTELKNEKSKLISKGMLTKQDIYFTKCIKQYSTSKTLLWFLEFLKLKDAQPVQRSCLVGDIVDDYFVISDEPLYEFNTRYYFKLVVN